VADSHDLAIRLTSDAPNVVFDVIVRFAADIGKTKAQISRRARCPLFVYVA
jgi:hypothetical protein